MIHHSDLTEGVLFNPSEDENIINILWNQLASDCEFIHSVNMYESLLQPGPMTDTGNTKRNKILAYLQSTYTL